MNHEMHDQGQGRVIRAEGRGKNLASTPSALGPLFVSLVVLFCPLATADSIRLQNVTHKDVRVVGMREAQVFFRTPAGEERSVPLDAVLALELDKYPNLGKANEAFAKEDFAAAAKLLSPIVDEAKDDYVRVLAGAQLVAALDRSGRFLDAARRYAKLLQIDNGRLVKSVQPVSLPAEAAERSAAADKLAQDAKATSDPLARRYLEQTVAALKSDAAAEPSGGPGAPAKPQAGLLRTTQETERDPIDDAIAAGKHEQALRLADEAIAGKAGSLPRLLHQRGLAQAALGREDDALLSHMRVVIHFTPRSGPYYGKSLVEAGKIFAQQGKTAHARQLLTEAKAILKEEAEEAKTIEELMNGLPEE